LIESTSFDILNLALAELHPAAAVAVAVSLRERFSGKRSHQGKRCRQRR
jgi:hypothetical protein